MARIKLIGVRFSASEFLRIGSAAEASGAPIVSWLRNLALRAAAETTPPSETHARQAVYPDPPDRLTCPARTRLTQADYENLEDHARACGVTVAAYIRRVVLGVRPVVRRPELHSAIVALNRVGTNLNQLVHLANSGILLTPDLLSAIAGTLAEIHGLRAAILREDGQHNELPAEAEGSAALPSAGAGGGPPE